VPLVSDRKQQTSGHIKQRLQSLHPLYSMATRWRRCNNLVLTSVLPADILQVEVWVAGHVFLYPGPTVDLLVCRRDDEVAGAGTETLVIFKWSWCTACLRYKV